MTRDRWIRWAGELVVIVLGVLVALGVDDWRQQMAERQLEANLVERLREDLVADAGDLALAQLILARRRWLYGAITESLAGADPASLQPPDSLVRAEWARVPMAAAGRPEAETAGMRWTPLEAPLATLAGGVQFDLADDSFQEMIVSGALRALRDQELRAAILAYYRTAEDHGANVDGFEEYYYVLLDLLLDAGVSLRDPLDFRELTELARNNPRLAVQFRFGQDRIRFQTGFLDRIHRTRVELERVLAE